MSVVRTYNLFLDSQFANVRVPTLDTRDITFYLRKAIEPTNATNRFRVRVNTAEIPFSFSQVNATNNTFVVYLDSLNIGTITIDPGNYDILTLITQIQKAVIDLLTAIGSTATLAITFDQSTGKCAFTFTSAGQTLKFYFGTTILLSMIGFDPKINGAFVAIPGNAGGLTTYSVKNVNVCPTTCVYISSRSFTQSQNYEALTNGLDVTDVIGKIQLSTLPQTYLMYLNYTGEFVEINNKSITEINLYLSTNLVDFLDMSDMRWSIQLIIEEVAGPNNGTVTRLDEIQPGEPELPQALNDLIEKKQQLLEKLKKYRSALSNNSGALSNNSGSTGNVDGKDQLVRDDVVGR